MWVYIWLGIFVLSMIIEFVSFELVSVWISFGSLVSLVLALCGVGFEIQIIVAVTISIVCILSLRKVALKFLTKEKGKTNLDVAVDTIHKVLSGNSDDEYGTIKYNGVIWNIVSFDGKTLSEGDSVKIIKVDGNKFIVEKVEKRGE